MLFQVPSGVFTYNKAVQQMKKVSIIWDSMPKSVNLGAIKRKLRGKMIVYCKTFTGVNSVHMNHHIISTLLEDKPNMIILH